MNAKRHKLKVHLRAKTNDRVVACGAHANEHRFTREEGNVTCARCLRLMAKDMK